MSQVGNLIGTQRAASAGVLGPAEHPGLEECAIDDQLPASLEQVEQANLTLGPADLVILLHPHPWHMLGWLRGFCVSVGSDGLSSGRWSFGIGDAAWF